MDWNAWNGMRNFKKKYSQYRKINGMEKMDWNTGNGMWNSKNGKNLAFWEISKTNRTKIVEMLKNRQNSWEENEIWKNLFKFVSQEKFIRCLKVRLYDVYEIL